MLHLFYLVVIICVEISFHFQIKGFGVFLGLFMSKKIERNLLIMTDL